MNAAVSYFDRTMELLGRVRERELAAIEQAAEACASRIATGGLVFLFGNGHSRMMCEEMTPRQGCFPGFVALVELALSNHADIVGSQRPAGAAVSGEVRRLRRRDSEELPFRSARCVYHYFHQRDPSGGGGDGGGRQERDGMPVIAHRLAPTLRAGASRRIPRERS